ncbi:MAG: FRG domain-containing protein [Ruminococcus flavefaciens]|nr:FRG domain-containing protein [Ruminococcus flavefaciens]
MWFRGHARSFFNLEPSIFRGTDYQYNAERTYSNNHLREEYRFQSFMSRNYDNVDYRMPQTVIEWQEVMQHFFTKTRLMDWSESLTVALEFALESFITPIRDLEIIERCRVADPVIWILQPVKLNRSVYASFIEQDEGLIKKAIATKGLGTVGLAERIWDELKKEEKSGLYYNMGDRQDKNMNTMIGLSSLEIIRKAYKGREMEALRTFEMNPFFYLLLRYYSDGIPVQMGKLPPLAIIHPYHSQRIKIQRGVFTVFPYYLPDENMQKIKELAGNYPSIGMEYMPQCAYCLHSIQIVNPQRVAKELMQTGARRGNLYPDMQIVSQDMENAAK